MRYMGGKYRQARFIAPIILDYMESSGADTYWEPFVGGGSIAARVVPHVKRAILTDNHPDLILMWQALQYGWKPPSELSETEWRQLKNAPSSALRAFAGFGCSFGGRWFEGYGRFTITKNNPYPLAQLTASKLEKDIRALRKATFLHADYRQVKPKDWVIYADPPYAGTKAYSGMPPFDTAEFWNVAHDWAAKGATVLVSEYNAPKDAVCVWEREAHVSLNRDKQMTATERLFVL